MGKNVRLVNIYIKIHNKKPLTMSDLVFLAKYDRVCFEKTCQNVLYKMPESQPLMKKAKEAAEAPVKKAAVLPAEEPPVQREYSRRDQVETVLARLQKLEAEELMVQDVNVDKVKNLIGNLFMEKLFPHNDKVQYFDMQESGTSMFNKKV